MTQSEQQSENNLIEQLGSLGYEVVGNAVADLSGLEKNLKTQLEKLNAESLKKNWLKKIWLLFFCLYYIII